MGKRIIDPSVKEAYLEWLKTPPSLRDPKTKKGMAEEIGVTERTLQNWEATDEFRDELLRFKKQLASRMYADLIGAAYDIAMHGPAPQRMPAIKLLLDHINLTDEEEEAKATLSDEVRQAIQEIIERDGYEIIGN